MGQFFSQVLGCLDPASYTIVNGNLIHINGGGGSPAGPDTAVQFKDGAAFGGNANFTFDKTTNSFNLLGDGTGIASILYGASQETGITIDGPGPQVQIAAGDVGGTVDISSDVGITLECNTGATGAISATTGPTSNLFLKLDPVANVLTLQSRETGGTIRVTAKAGINFATDTAGMDFQATSGPVSIESDDDAIELTGATNVTLSIGSPVVEISGSALAPTLGFFGVTPVVKPTVTGAKAGNTAMTLSLLAALVALGLVTDGTT